MKRFAVLVAAVALFATWSVAPAGAGAIPVSVEGTEACDSTTGDHVITWTFTNGTGSVVDLTSVDVESTPADPSLATSAFNPEPVPAASDSTATTTIDGDFVGSVQIDIGVSLVGGPSTTVQAGVELPEPCEQPVEPTTTTTTLATTTTVAAQPLVRTPTFTG
jgi:hypothetical protein